MELGPTLFLLAHPGHELFLYGWMQRLRPQVFVMTDGSGRSGKPRIEPSLAIIRDAGGTPGGVFGGLEDLALYEHVLAGRIDFLSGLVARASDAILEEGIHSVAADALERRFLAHDLCHEMARAAVDLAALRSDRPIALYDYRLLGYEGRFPYHRPSEPLEIHLDDETFETKVRLARSLPGRELQAEVDQLIALRGLEGFRREELRTVGPPSAHREPEVPGYERHAERLAAAGRVERVIRYREHVLPLVQGVRRSVGLPPSAAAP